MSSLVRPLTFLIFVSVLTSGSTHALDLVQETAAELMTTADLNGDGLEDVVLADKRTGRIRPAYQQPDGMFKWVDWRGSGARDLTGMSAGTVLNADAIGLAFASMDGNQVTLLELASPTTPTAPVEIPFLLLGPAAVVAVDIGGEGNTPSDDLVVASVYNAPDENMLSLFRNRDGEAESVADTALPGAPRQGNRINIAGQMSVGLMLDSADAATFQMLSFAGGKADTVLSLTGLPVGTEYTVTRGTDGNVDNLLFYAPGSNDLAGYRIRTTAEGSPELAEAIPHTLTEPIARISPLTQNGQPRLFVVHGGGAAAGIYAIGSGGTPRLAQTLSAPSNHLFSAAVGVSNGFLAFSAPATGGSSTRYQVFTWDGDRCKEGIYGSLPSLADNDNLTLPGIHERIVAADGAPAAQDMAPYTNTIPGSAVSYVMLPIPGGEFLMGSPESEPGRKADEGPQHRVQVAPFWMGRCEVTWNEFELFMYKDEEKKMRERHTTDAAGDKLADAVTHPSKPYTDMTFGMGRDDYPAIAMTQHAANKYCQWLSAKTGHFYRLPTEAEWEYACRAGTTTAWFFGDDDGALGQYAWYEDNSDFKYQKVGRKKPNPWGLHDVYGNVVEWVLDQYDPEFYRLSAGSDPAVQPWNKATRPYPHSVRGGSWDDPPTACRSAARRGSTRAWKLQDPQMPKSTWYFTDADFVGFRLVRPLEVPDPMSLRAYWNSGVERD